MWRSWGRLRAGFGAGTRAASSPGVRRLCPTLGPFNIACGAADPDLSTTEAAASAPSPIASSSAIGAGAFHSCGVTPQGTLECWGCNVGGASTPPAGDGYVQVAAGRYHTRALRTDGSVGCFGYGGYGMTAPPAATSFSAVTSGAFFSCGLQTDGAIACWGWGGYGLTNPPAGSFTAIEAGAYHVCALDGDGQATCWGANNQGKSNPPDEPFIEITDVPLAAPTILGSADGEYCAITDATTIGRLGLVLVEVQPRLLGQLGLCADLSRVRHHRGG